MLTRFENAGAAVLQADLHLAAQDEHPLRRDGAMKLAAKTDRAVAQLVATRRHQRRQHRVWIALRQGDSGLAEFGAAIGVGEENGLGESGHGELLRKAVVE